MNDSLAHLQAILAKWKTQPGYSEARTMPGAALGPGEKPQRGTEEHLRDLTYGLDLAREALQKLTRKVDEALAAPAPLEGLRVDAALQLRHELEALAAETVPELAQLRGAVVALEHQADHPEGPPAWLVPVLAGLAGLFAGSALLLFVLLVWSLS